MTTRFTSLIDEALGAWAYTREGVVAEVKDLPESALDSKPTGASRTARALVQHIIESVLLMSGDPLLVDAARHRSRGIPPRTNRHVRAACRPHPRADEADSCRLIPSLRA